MDFSASYAHGAGVRSTGGCEGTLGADGPPAGAISAESATSVNPVTPTKKISIDAESAEWIQKMELELEGLRIKPSPCSVVSIESSTIADRDFTDFMKNIEPVSVEPVSTEPDCSATIEPVSLFTVSGWDEPDIKHGGDHVLPTSDIIKIQRAWRRKIATMTPEFHFRLGYHKATKRHDDKMKLGEALLKEGPDSSEDIRLWKEQVQRLESERFDREYDDYHKKYYGGWFKDDCFQKEYEWVHPDMEKEIVDSGHANLFDWDRVLLSAKEGLRSAIAKWPYELERQIQIVKDWYAREVHKLITEFEKKRRHEQPAKLAGTHSSADFTSYSLGLKSVDAGRERSVGSHRTRLRLRTKLFQNSPSDEEFDDTHSQRRPVMLYDGFFGMAELTHCTTPTNRT